MWGAPRFRIISDAFFLLSSLFLCIYFISCVFWCFVCVFCFVSCHVFSSSVGFCVRLCVMCLYLWLNLTLLICASFFLSCCLTALCKLVLSCSFLWIQCPSYDVTRWVRPADLHIVCRLLICSLFFPSFVSCFVFQGLFCLFCFFPLSCDIVCLGVRISLFDCSILERFPHYLCLARFVCLFLVICFFGILLCPFTYWLLSVLVQLFVFAFRSVSFLCITDLSLILIGFFGCRLSFPLVCFCV